MACPSAEAPRLSIVIGSNGAAGSVEACLTALEPQIDGAEVLVCEPEPSSPELRIRFPFARFLERRGALVPALWRDGIDTARAPIVALTISPMAPAPDWVETIHAQLQSADVVAGAVEPGEGLRLSDWAEYFCRYAGDMLPFPPHACADLPGDNAAYRREALEQAKPLYGNGFWEPVVHSALEAGGASLWHAPELVVRQGRSAGASAFARQRIHHGRAHARARGAQFGRGRNLVGVLGAPLVPPLLAWRSVRETRRRRRLRLRALAALPLILFFDAAWAVGEALGHLDVLRGR